MKEITGSGNEKRGIGGLPRAYITMNKHRMRFDMTYVVQIGKWLVMVLLLTAIFLAGRSLGRESVQTQAVSASARTSENWGLGGYGKEVQPTGIVSGDLLKEYNAYYVGDADQKVIYLTFDAGFENGNTAPILDALKKHQVPATFFLVGHYLETAPELVKRMAEEGHTVGNHTYHHPDMSQISELSDFRTEMEGVASLYQEITGASLSMFYRPPQGKYSLENLKMAKELGYHTFFWSLAYVDWYEDNQPSHEEALEKLTGRIHPGAIVLLHSTSRTNAEILDELLTRWESMGYEFRSLSELVNK